MSSGGVVDGCVLHVHKHPVKTALSDEHARRVDAVELEPGAQRWALVSEEREGMIGSHDVVHGGQYLLS